MSISYENYSVTSQDYDSCKFHSVTRAVDQGAPMQSAAVDYQWSGPQAG